MKLIKKLGRDKTKQYYSYLGLFECECGTNTILNISNGLKQNVCSICNDKSRSSRNTKHGDSGARLNRIWKAIKTRCYNKNSKDYKWYGSKGITVCQEWKHSYTVFKEWAINNGYSDELTIDRIDSSLGYSPDNCRWIPHSENVKRASLKYTKEVIEEVESMDMSFYKACGILGYHYGSFMRARRSSNV